MNVVIAAVDAFVAVREHGRYPLVCSCCECQRTADSVDGVVELAYPVDGVIAADRHSSPLARSARRASVRQVQWMM